ncbi:MAG TPA: PHP-associated domain-containing protein [Ktedonobacterales bacterium]
MKSTSSNEFIGRPSRESENASVNEDVYEETIAGSYERDEAANVTLEHQPGDGLADVHMHTNYSDGTGSVEEVLSFVETYTPLDVIAITDHDTIEGALRARDLAAQRDYPFEVIVGEEISTREGHMLALFLEKRVPPDLSIERSIELVHAQGGLAIIAHPFNPVFRHSVQRKVMNRLLRQPEVHPDGIETLNGSFAGIGSSRVAMTLARTVYHWAETGSSDAHTTTAVGCARTVFPGHNAAEFRRAVEARRTAPEGRYWQAREYVAFVSHRMVYGGGATFEQMEPRRTAIARIGGFALQRSTRMPLSASAVR